MPPERVRRQQPVSCTRCRQRKLRCDRQLPCSNCQSRHIDCVYASQRTALNAYGEVSRHDIPSSGMNELRNLRAEHEILKARISTIEHVVLGNRGESSESAPSATRLKDHAAISEPLPPASPESDDVVAWTADPRWLERVGNQNSSRTSGLVRPLSIQVSTLHHIVSTGLQATHSGTLLIPSLSEAMDLKYLFLERFDTIQHILYDQHVSEAIAQLYREIQHGRSHRPSHLALLLAICSSVAEACDLLPADPVAQRLAMYWFKGSLDIIENIWRSQAPDLETIQAILIMIYYLYHTEAFSSKARLLHATAVSLAKDIGLHKTDSDMSDHGGTPSRAEIIQKEIFRRVWWHLTAIDWGFLVASGLHEGTYSINPRHMRVNKPRNINDDDLATMPADFCRPAAEPTAMAFSLHCIRMGEVCREVADTTWDLMGAQINDALYDSTIIPLDRKFDDLIATTPPFLRIDCVDQRGNAPCARMTMQRCFTYISIQTRRCRLHLPYLMRTGRCRSYRFSRLVCLDAARKILQLRDRIPHVDLGITQTGNAVRTVGFLPHFFHATAVLVVDLSFNRDAIDATERKTEIQSACKVFEDTRPSASLYLDVLKAVMQRHKLRVKGDVLEKDADASADSAHANANRHQYMNMETDNPAIGPEADMDLNHLWQSYLDTDPGLQEWDDLFSQLDGGVQ